jgi:hypothetical protein
LDHVAGRSTVHYLQKCFIIKTTKYQNLVNHYVIAVDFAQIEKTIMKNLYLWVNPSSNFQPAGGVSDNSGSSTTEGGDRTTNWDGFVCGILTTHVDICPANAGLFELSAFSFRAAFIPFVFDAAVADALGAVLGRNEGWQTEGFGAVGWGPPRDGSL